MTFESEYHVLLVDDIPGYLEAMEMLLPESLTPLRAKNVEEARLLFVQKSPTLCVIDVRLSEDDPENREGLELLRWIKESDRSTPVIMISAYLEFEFEAQALDLGADAFLRKPISPDEFRAVVKKALAGQLG